MALSISMESMPHARPWYKNTCTCKTDLCYMHVHCIVYKDKNMTEIMQDYVDICNVRWPLTMILKTIQKSGQYRTQDNTTVEPHMRTPVIT